MPIASAVLHPGATADPQALIEWTNSHVDAKFQRIRDVVIMETFLRNVVGKMLKREIRDDYKAGDLFFSTRPYQRPWVHNGLRHSDK